MELEVESGFSDFESLAAETDGNEHAGETLTFVTGTDSLATSERSHFCSKTVFRC